MSWSNGLSITSWHQQEYLYNIRFISDRELTTTAKALYGSDLSAKPSDESTHKSKNSFDSNWFIASSSMSPKGLITVITANSTILQKMSFMACGLLWY